VEGDDGGGASRRGTEMWRAAMVAARRGEGQTEGVTRPRFVDFVGFLGF
jgi:hypothetical protein